VTQGARAKGWARIWPAIRPPHSRNLRAGAWYPITGDENEDRVTVVIGSGPVQVPRRVLEIRRRRPKLFSVVHRVGYHRTSQRGSLHRLGEFYAVCPECSGRFALYGRPGKVWCPACKYEGEVAWWETA